ncbi:sodium:proton antiporter [Aquabacterium sp. A7-Y]|uniref:cation:proton antiporter n=1 Tax=Aquabacterium sp. A7-Y TaxID=1349605 RepID=UPI00223E7E85|nr:sodium:proton antiporter [Aquabacterium sp. A7-Y]MCW7540495.1 sodium:proton antiporter [Aquabacterium sp. A7-Y]
MTLFQVSGAVLTAVAVFGYINHRFIRLPDTLGTTVVGLVASLVLLAFGFNESGAVAQAQKFVQHIDFSEVVFHGLLGLLLFAGSLHVNFSELKTRLLPIFLLATLGVVSSTLVVGYGLHYGLRLVGQEVPLLHCLVFGALISPTDPIAVLGILKKAGAPKNVELKITGESLFNDGTAVVAFLLLLGLASGKGSPTVGGTAMLLLKEVAGGIGLGLVIGWGVVALLREVHSYLVEILATLAAAVGGYALAEALHVSAPLTVVVAGLMVGNKGAVRPMSEATREHLFSFWTLLDEILNLVLFGLIGMMILALSFGLENIVASAIAIPVVLFARWMSVVVSLGLSRVEGGSEPHAVKVLTWGGLRGGISIALALSLPQMEGRSMLISAAYAVVLFSLLVQAPTLGPLIERLKGGAAAKG